MKQEFKEEAAVIFEKLARIAASSDTICVAQKSSELLAQFWALVAVGAASIQREEAGRAKRQNWAWGK